MLRASFHNTGTIEIYSKKKKRQDGSTGEALFADASDQCQFLEVSILRRPLPYTHDACWRLLVAIGNEAIGVMLAAKLIVHNRMI